MISFVLGLWYVQTRSFVKREVIQDLVWKGVVGPRKWAKTWFKKEKEKSYFHNFHNSWKTEIFIEIRKKKEKDEKGAVDKDDSEIPYKKKNWTKVILVSDS